MPIGRNIALRNSTAAVSTEVAIPTPTSTGGLPGTAVSQRETPGLRRVFNRLVPAAARQAR
ncbi:hypothetical protein ACAK56_001346 [Salmonella enterica]